MELSQNLFYMRKPSYVSLKTQIDILSAFAKADENILFAFLEENLSFIEDEFGYAVRTELSL